MLYSSKDHKQEYLRIYQALQKQSAEDNLMTTTELQNTFLLYVKVISSYPSSASPRFCTGIYLHQQEELVVTYQFWQAASWHLNSLPFLSDLIQFTELHQHREEKDQCFNLQRTLIRTAKNNSTLPEHLKRNKIILIIPFHII